MEKMMMPAYYNVLSTEEMTYTEGGSSKSVDALCGWLLFPFYGWFKGSMAIRNYRRQHPNDWFDTGLDAFGNELDKGAVNFIAGAINALSVGTICATGFGIIPTALIVFS